MSTYWNRQFTAPGDLDDVPTTKRFARSTNEAFPQSAEYSAAIEAPAPRRRAVINALPWIAAFALLFFAFYVLPRIWK